MTTSKVMRRPIAAVCAVLFSQFVNYNYAYSQSIDGDSLNLITQTAREICGAYQTTGGSSSIEIDGEVNAKIEGLLKKLANAGIGGSGVLKQEDYSSVLREELGDELKSIRKCREGVFDRLMNSLEKEQAMKDECEFPYDPRSASFKADPNIMNPPNAKLPKGFRKVSVGIREYINDGEAESAIKSAEAAFLGSKEMFGPYSTQAYQRADILVEVLGRVGYLGKHTAQIIDLKNQYSQYAPDLGSYGCLDAIG